MFIHESGSIDKPAIIFLHGNGAHGGMWKAHFDALVPYYHCLAPDFPGYGESQTQEWISLEETVKEIMMLIRTRTKHARAHIVGLSLGSSVALMLLSKAPHLVNHAIIDGAGVLPLPGVAFMKIGLRLLQPWLHTEVVIKTIAQAMKIPPDGYAEFSHGMRAMSPVAFTRSFSQALSLRQPPGLARVHCRVLLVAGEKEPQAVNQSNVMLASVMPNAQCCVAPGVGHGWLAAMPALHINMVRAWLNNEPLPRPLIRQRAHSMYNFPLAKAGQIS